MSRLLGLVLSALVSTAQSEGPLQFLRSYARLLELGPCPTATLFTVLHSNWPEPELPVSPYLLLAQKHNKLPKTVNVSCLVLPQVGCLSEAQLRRPFQAAAGHLSRGFHHSRLGQQAARPRSSARAAAQSSVLDNGAVSRVATGSNGKGSTAVGQIIDTELRSEAEDSYVAVCCPLLHHST